VSEFFELQLLVIFELNGRSVGHYEIFTSMYFLALSQAPPVLDAEIAIYNSTEEIPLETIMATGLPSNKSNPITVQPRTR